MWPHPHPTWINTAWMRDLGHWEHSGAEEETLLCCHGTNPPACTCPVSVVCLQCSLFFLKCWVGAHLVSSTSLCVLSSVSVSVLINVSRLVKRNRLFFLLAAHKITVASGSWKENQNRLKKCSNDAVIHCSTNNKECDECDGVFSDTGRSMRRTKAAQWELNAKVKSQISSFAPNIK